MNIHHYNKIRPWKRRHAKFTLKQLRLFVISLSLIVMGILIWKGGKFCVTHTLLSNRILTVGTELDSYKGVPVYSNGINPGSNHGPHSSETGYYYGQKWQCVEFIKRFYKIEKGHSMPNPWGHAKDIFNPHLNDGALNRERGLIQYLNGGNTPPQLDDIIVFNNTRYGHVAIITKVKRNKVEIIQQNVPHRPRQTLKMIVENGRYRITGNAAHLWRQYIFQLMK